MDMQFTEMGSEGLVHIRFKYDGLEVDFRISPAELVNDLVQQHPQTARARLEAQSEKIMWRQLFYYLKASLTAIKYRIRKPEEILLAAIALPGGGTVGDNIGGLLENLQCGQLALPGRR
jgi:hypothetical protein